MRSIKILTAFLLFSTFSIAFFSCNGNPCKDINCENGGTCVEGTCNCPGGFSGTNCEIEDLCYDVTCMNGGTCVDGTCDCPPGYSGADCSFDSCTVKVCENGGTCLNGLCDCTTGYEGTLCDTKYNAKFTGTYTVDEACTISGSASGTNTYSITITASSTDPAGIRFNNLKDAASSHSATVQESNTRTFIIASQPLGANTISGTGEINASGTTVTIILEEDLPGDNEICTLTFTRM